MKNTKNCALVLAGCGAKDGSEITEAVSLLIAFNQAGFKVEMFAPDRSVHHVVNHLTDQEIKNENRNILTEAARIARGNIKPIEDINVHNYDVLCFAGGFGVAKNLCDFAFTGKNATLKDDVKKIIFNFIQEQKVVSALCIAPVLIALAAKELQLQNVKITLGDGLSDAATIVQSWGIHHESKKVFEACVDAKNKFVSAPAYMDDNATSADIFSSATALVKGINELL